MNGPELSRCPHGKPSSGPGVPTDECADCKSRKCQHGRYNMNHLGNPEITCPQCQETQELLKAGSKRPR
jgi:hypothetical protein